MRVTKAKERAFWAWKNITFYPYSLKIKLPALSSCARAPWQSDQRDIYQRLKDFNFVI